MTWNRIGLWGCSRSGFLDLWNNNRTIRYAKTLGPNGSRIMESEVDIAGWLPTVPVALTGSPSGGAWPAFDATAFGLSGGSFATAPQGPALAVLRDDPSSVLLLDGDTTNRSAAGVTAGVGNASATARALPAQLDGYVYVDAATINTMTVPDAAALDIVGTISMWGDIAPNVWSSGSQQTILGKWEASGQFSYQLSISTTGFLELRWSNDGTTVNLATSTVGLGAMANESRLTIGATLVPNNGAAGRTISFFTKTTPGPYGTWTALGVDVVQATASSVFASTSLVRVANTGATTTQFGGKIYGAGLVGNAVFAAAPALWVDCTCLSAVGATSFLAVTGQTVAISRAASSYVLTIVPARDPFGFVRFTGAVNNLIENDSTTLRQPDMAVIAKVSADDWGKSGTIAARWSSTAANCIWMLSNNLGFLQLQISSVSGALQPTYTSSVVIPGAIGQPLTVAATLDGDNGAAGTSVRFWTSTNDGRTWTQLGTTQTTLGPTTLNGNTATKTTIGAYGVAGAGLNPWFGRIYRVEVRSSLAADFRPGPVADTYIRWTGNIITSPTTMVSNPDYPGTWTLQGSAAYLIPAMWGRGGWLIGQSTAGVLVSDHPKLNFGSGMSESFTAMVAARPDVAAQPSAGKYLSKHGSGVAGYNIAASTTTLAATATATDATTTVTTAATAANTQYTPVAFGARVNRTAQTIEASKDGTMTATSSIAAVTTEAGAANLKLGNDGLGGLSPVHASIFGGAIVRRALTNTEMTAALAALRDGTEQYVAGQAWQVTTIGQINGLDLIVGDLLVCKRSGTLGTAAWVVLSNEQQISYGLTSFSNPISDGAWWYDPAHVESAYFFGMQVTRVSGLEDNNLAVDVLPHGCDSLRYGTTTNRGFTITVEAILHGSTCCGVAYGLRRLRRALESCCTSGCSGTRLRMMQCVPNPAPCIPAGYTATPELTTNIDPWRNLVNVRMVEQPAVMGTSGLSCGCGCAPATRIMFTLRADGALYTDPDLAAIPVITLANGATPATSISSGPCPTVWPSVDPAIPPLQLAIPATANSALSLPTTANTRYTTRFVTIPVGEEWDIEWELYAGTIKELRNLRVLVWPNLAGADTVSPGISVYSGMYTTCNAVMGFAVQYVQRLATWERKVCEGVRAVIGSGYAEPSLVYPPGGGAFNPFVRLGCGKWTILVEADANNTGSDATLTAIVRRVEL